MMRRLLPLVPLLVLLCGLMSVASAGGRWVRSTDGGCLVWDPLPQPEEVITWSGACVDGKASGPGTEVSQYRVDAVQKEERYTGDMQAGRPHGYGTLVYDNGDRYEGQFVRSRRAGLGVYTHANGDRYEGEFREDRRTGRGTFTYHQGGQFEGDFVNGLFDGVGRFTFPDGARYDGHFKHGMANGTGALTDAAGAALSGRWVSGCLRRGERVGPSAPPGRSAASSRRRADQDFFAAPRVGRRTARTLPLGPPPQKN